MAGDRKGTRKPEVVTLETVRRLALVLPETEEGTSYGTPAFKVRGKLFARLHQGGDSLVVRIEADERAVRMRADPETFYITDHYVGYPWMLVRLASVYPDDLAELITDAWRRCAPKRVVAAYDNS